MQDITRRAALTGVAAAATAVAPIAMAKQPDPFRERLVALTAELRALPTDTASCGAYCEVQLVADRLDEILGQQTLPPGKDRAYLEHLYRLRSQQYGASIGAAGVERSIEPAAPSPLVQTAFDAFKAVLERHHRHSQDSGLEGLPFDHPELETLEIENAAFGDKVLDSLVALVETPAVSISDMRLKAVAVRADSADFHDTVPKEALPALAADIERLAGGAS